MPQEQIQEPDKTEVCWLCGQKFLATEIKAHQQKCADINSVNLQTEQDEYLAKLMSENNTSMISSNQQQLQNIEKNDRQPKEIQEIDQKKINTSTIEKPLSFKNQMQGMQNNMKNELQNSSEQIQKLNTNRQNLEKVEFNKQIQKPNINQQNLEKVELSKQIQKPTIIQQSLEKVELNKQFVEIQQITNPTNIDQKIKPNQNQSQQNNQVNRERNLAQQRSQPESQDSFKSIPLNNSNLFKNLSENTHIKIFQVNNQQQNQNEISNKSFEQIEKPLIIDNTQMKQFLESRNVLEIDQQQSQFKLELTQENNEAQQKAKQKPNESIIPLLNQNNNQQESNNPSVYYQKNIQNDFLGWKNYNPVNPQFSQQLNKSNQIINNCSMPNQNFIQKSQSPIQKYNNPFNKQNSIYERNFQMPHWDLKQFQSERYNPLQCKIKEGVIKKEKQFQNQNSEKINQEKITFQNQQNSQMQPHNTQQVHQINYLKQDKSQQQQQQQQQKQNEDKHQKKIKQYSDYSSIGIRKQFKSQNMKVPVQQKKFEYKPGMRLTDDEVNKLTPEEIYEYFTQVDLEEQVGFKSKIMYLGKKKTQIEEVEHCTICMEDIQPSTEATDIKLDCDHIFHYDCIKQWLQLHKNCPICKDHVELMF